MFGRKKQQVEEVTVTVVEENTTPAPTGSKTGGKGAPTPKRKAQEAARKRPLVPEDRKLARLQERQASTEQRAKVRQAMNTGDEKYLPERDKGARRRYIRDYVDARYSVGEFFMIAALIVILISLIQNPVAVYFSTIGFFVVIALVVIDAIWLRFSLKKRLGEKFGGLGQGDTYYAIMRAIQLRRMRMPKPQVKRGQFPR